MPVLKSLFPKIYTIYACNDNTVYYLIKYKGRLVWRTLNELDDCKDMFCFLHDFYSKSIIMEIVDCLKNGTSVCGYVFDENTGNEIYMNKLPIHVTNIQISDSIPTIEDGKMWVNDKNFWQVDL